MGINGRINGESACTAHKPPPAHDEIQQVFYSPFITENQYEWLCPSFVWLGWKQTENTWSRTKNTPLRGRFRGIAPLRSDSRLLGDSGSGLPGSGLRTRNIQ
ncbi:hypothetical protein Zmor_008025 [Zophobas morio]|uniref:Uncharacterized protein n=1 Tax=Zophobas morio TaxID=2755281 RepID=A0AA38MPD0_9CUCU|nr:hypothetical protein Zmor_008025 [Zophobas morio]